LASKPTRRDAKIAISNGIRDTGLWELVITQYMKRQLKALIYPQRSLVSGHDENCDQDQTEQQSV
jgi:hypothetical protein